MARILPLLAKVVAVLAVYLVVQAMIMTGVVDDYILITMVTICVNIILAVSLNLITGFTGQFSLGHAGFMSIGAYTTGLLTMHYPTWWAFLLGLLAGGAIAAIIGFLVGLPTLRLRGDYLAIATLGMAEIIRVLFLNFPFTNGAAGLSGMPRFVNWTWLYVFTAGTVILISNFLRSMPGRNLIAVREDEIAASSIGVNAVRAKTLAFVVGAFFGGLAGGLYSSYFYFIKPDLFGFQKSIDILIIVVLGGLGSLTGSVIAAILLAVISSLLQPFPELRMVIYGLILVVVMVFRPQGLMGDRELTFSAMRRLLPHRWREARP
ncbi:MAG: branched-chain amino acid ABC transporter permease [Propionibacteriaceae bacterium]|nr:branched-chain amino acid ABC transporter permease [Propionibacteriaceae bacterium]